MMDYEKTPCFCGEQARIVVCQGVGVYVRCPFCDRCSFIYPTKEAAIKGFKERYGNEGCNNREAKI